MLEAIVKIIDVLMPLFVAIATVYGGIIVAKIGKLQKDMKTNHGSTSPGNAIDRIYEKVELISKDLAELRADNKKQDARILRLEQRGLFGKRRKNR